MSAIHKLSSLAPLPELDLFGVPPTQTSISRDIFVDYRPISILDSSSPVTFVVTTSIDEYIQLRESLLHMVIQINLKPPEGKEISALEWTKIHPVNYFLHSMFKQIDVEINGKPITNSPQTYGYKAMLESLLGFSNDARETQLSAAGWIADSNTDKESIVPARSKLITPSSIKKSGTGIEIDLIGKLHIDLAFQNRALLGGCELKITLVPNDPKFYLQLSDDKIQPVVLFKQAALWLHKSKITPSIIEAHHIALKTETAKYPYTKGDVKTFTISSGTHTYNIDNVISGILPRRLFIMFVDNKSFNGTYDTNPYNFKHKNLNYLACYVNGIQTPTAAFTPNFKNKIFTREYMALFEALNQITTDTVIPFNKDQWANGNTIFGLNLSPDLSDGCGLSGHVNPIEKGNIRLELKFAEPLAETTNVLVYCEYDSLLQIDINREPFVDFM